MEQEVPVTFSELLKDYPFIAKGLTKLGIQTPLDLQDQLLSIPNQLQNLIICAPEGSGKQLALLILAIKKFANEEQGILGLISHSKEMSQQLASLSAAICRTPLVNLFMGKCQNSYKKQIIIGSPLQMSQLDKSVKDKFLSVSIFEADFIFSFGYGEHLHKLAESLPKSTFYQISCLKRSPEVTEFKDKWMKSVTKIDYQPPEEPVAAKNQKLQGQVVHYFEAGQKIIIPITLYVSLKFGLVNPKVLILTQNLREVYRYYLFLERCKIQGIGLYNHENPIDLKFYGLSTWMNGTTNILIATKQIYNDLDSDIFKANCKKNYKRNHFALTNLSTVIAINLKHLGTSYHQVFKHLNNKPVIMTLIESTQEEVESLQAFIGEMKKTFDSIKSKEYPISKKELEGFRYRISDVFSSLGNRKVEYLQQYDFKKKMYRSPDLKEYFAEHEKQKQVLIKQISELKKKINAETVCLSQFVPQYLVPQILKGTYNEQLKQIQKNAKQEEVPEYIKKARNALRHVDLEEEDPQVTDISRLKLVSSRKRWKLQHGFKLKKRNLRKEKKGIFERE